MTVNQRTDRIANTTQDMIEAQRQTYETMTDSFIGFQKRNVEFFQSGQDLAELQEHNAEVARDLVGSMGSTNFVTNCTKVMELGQRNAQFFQSWITGGVDYLRNQAQHNQKTAEAFVKSAREQQEGLRKLGEAEIERWVRSGNGLDKAGGYAIQDAGAALVAGLDGCYTNVVGLSLPAVVAAASRLGVALV